MKKENINITFPGGNIQLIEKGTKLIDLAREFQKQHDTPIVLARVNNSYKELNSSINEDGVAVEFLDLSTKDGMRVYQRSTTFLMIVAARNIAPHVNIRVNHHINGGYFCELENQDDLDDVFLLKVKNEMTRLVSANMKINKRSVTLDGALKLFEENRMCDKKTLFKYRRASRVNIYELDGSESYFYGYMVPSTGYITGFELTAYNNGFVLQFPDEKNPSTISPFTPEPKLSSIFNESE